ncbi:helix-turn-helix domain-containing protein [Curvibacter lanceolatus]|uniref:helix-turn-helix domain-containing protein n=1 Tax=Curvibacter lanceolatus TaxID=86182 RepID=UPI0003A67BB1|nr:helix-turn-helix domain-containing protein [Curvibacter lanceolatus]
MSTVIMALCWPIRMRPPAKAVLISLADMANDEGYCWPSIERLCERTCFGRTAVIEAISWLEERCILRADRSNGRKTVYWVEPDLYVEEGAESEGVHPAAQPPKRVPNQYATRTGPPRKPVRQADPTSPRGGLNRSATRTLTVKNRHESNNPLTPNFPDTPGTPAAAGGACGSMSSSQSQTRGPQSAIPNAPGFDAFWQAYPKRANEDAARREWNRLAPDAELQACMLAAIRAQQGGPAWMREGGRFIPMPSKWLAGRRWRDEPSPQAQLGLQDLWWESKDGVRAMGQRLGLPYSMAELGNAYTDDELLEHNRRYRERVFAAAGAGPWSQRRTA